MASIGNINAQGASGAQYAFSLYPLNTDFKPLGAVYMFLKGDVPVYVGETRDLSQRFDDHHKADEIRSHLADRIAILVESDGGRRLYIEADLLRNYRWPCNG
jgi:hypothetical protein